MRLMGVSRGHASYWVSLAGMHLMGVSLAGMHLRGVHLIGVSLAGMHLMGVSLAGMHLMGVSLAGMAPLYVPTQTFIIASKQDKQDKIINQVYAQNHLIPDHSDRGLPIRALQSGCAGSQEGFVVSRECSLTIRVCPILAHIDYFKKAPR